MGWWGAATIPSEHPTASTGPTGVQLLQALGQGNSAAFKQLEESIGGTVGRSCLPHVLSAASALAFLLHLLVSTCVHPILHMCCWQVMLYTPQHTAQHSTTRTTVPTAHTAALAAQHWQHHWHNTAVSCYRDTKTSLTQPHPSAAAAATVGFHLLLLLLLLPPQVLMAAPYCRC